MKIFLIILLILIIVILLNRSYSAIYDQIGQKHLPNPIANSDGHYNIPEEVAASPSGHQVKYIALGDSLTAGVGTDSYQDSFPYLISEKLAKDGNQVELINFGIPGARIKDVAERELPIVILEQPDIITLLIGVNDVHGFVSGENFKKSFTEIVDTLVFKTESKIIIINIPYLGSDNLIRWPYNLLYRARTEQFNKIIKKITAEKNLELIDLYDYAKKTASEKDYYAIDEFHPSKKGYRLWSTIINDRLNLQSPASN